MEGASPKPLKMFELKDKILKPALTSTYIVNIQPPNKPAIESKMKAYGITNTAPFRYDFLSIPCSEVSLPGSTVATNEIIDDHTGITERHAYRRLYDDRISLTFYVDSDQYYVIKFFEAWISVVVNEQLTGFELPTYNYRVSFPTDYYADALTVSKFEKNYGSNIPAGNELGNVLQYNFIQAFPISIDSMPLSYDSSQLLKCTVAFSYSRYKISNAVEKLPNSKNSNAPAIPEFYGPGLPGDAANELRNAYMQDLVVRMQQDPNLVFE
jgi:hypothetical protein